MACRWPSPGRPAFPLPGSRPLGTDAASQCVNCDDIGVSFWRAAENPRTRPLRSWAFDTGCAVVAGAAALARFSFGQAAHPVHLSLAAGVVVAVVMAAALPVRRVWPGPVFLWTLLASAVLAQWPDRGALFPVALAISLYTVAAMMRRAVAVAAAVLTAGVLLLVVAQDGTQHWELAISDAAGIAAAVLIVGLYVGTRRAYLAALRDRAQRLEIERDQSSALAAAQERARIAREMHDSVAHHLTVIVALSDGALRAVTRLPPRPPTRSGTCRALRGRRSPRPAACSVCCEPTPNRNRVSRCRASPTWTISSATSGRPACRCGMSSPEPPRTCRPRSSSRSSASSRKP